VDREGRTICIADAHSDGKRFVVRADEKLTAFVELERAIHEFTVSWFCNGCGEMCARLNSLPRFWNRSGDSEK